MKHFLIILIFILLPAEIVYSQNGWVPQFHDPTVGLRYIYFINENIGWAVGFHGNIVNTTDGGETWNSQTSGTNDLLYSVYFINPDTGFISGKGYILKTVNSGSNWDKINIDTMVGNNIIDIIELYTPSVDTAYFLGAVEEHYSNSFELLEWYHWYLLKSFDGFKSFEIIDRDRNDSTPNQYSNLYFPNRNFFHDEKIGYKLGRSGSLYKTYDDGLTWNWIGGFNYAFFVNSRVGYGLINHGYGYDGQIIIVKTTTGGE